jgi:TetR/AcrR family transcriptional repressor of nem operon
MAWQKEHKSQSKDKILQSAAMLFTHHGFEKVSIDQVMEKAELTRGAFYSHFSSKSDLYAQAITKAAQIAQRRKPAGQPTSIKEFGKYYLTKQHRDKECQQACPLAFLVSDISQQNEQVRTTYTKVFNHFVIQAEEHSTNREESLKNAVLLIGGLAISRALNDKELSDELLRACQTGLMPLVD